MPLAGFEPAIPAVKQLGTNALYRTATWISVYHTHYSGIVRYTVLSVDK
jgi:hypothetical protein